MPLRIPRYVEIQNPRLLIVFRVMQAGIIVPLCTVFFSKQGYLYERNIKDNIHIDPTVQGWQDTASLAEASKAQSGQPFCSSAHDYDFWGNAHDSLRYEDQRCAFICETGSSSGSCLHPPETWVQDNRQEFTLLTSFRDTVYQATATQTSHSYFVPGVEALSVGFNYVFKVGEDVTPKSGKDAVSMSSSAVDVTTRYIDFQGRIKKELPPGGDLRLSIRDLFELAGQDGYLDDIQTEAGANQLKDAKYQTGALGRIVGADLVVKVECDANQKLCDVSCELLPSTFVGGLQKDVIHEAGESYLRLRHYSGVRIRFVADGTIKLFDVNNVILNVSALFVYLALPRIIIRLFCAFALGHLSKVYKHLIYQNFDVSRETAGMACRLMSRAVMYHSLSVEKKGGTYDYASGYTSCRDSSAGVSSLAGLSTSFAPGRNNTIAGVLPPLKLNHRNSTGSTNSFQSRAQTEKGISRRQMALYIKDALRHRGEILDEHEVGQFVAMAFTEAKHTPEEQQKHRMATPRGRRARFSVHADVKSTMEVLGDIVSIFRSSRPNERQKSQPQGNLDIDEFAACCSSADPISFNNIVHLFDKDRYQHCLERFFTPKKLKATLQNAKEAAEVDVQIDAASSEEDMVDRISETSLETLGLPQPNGFMEPNCTPLTPVTPITPCQVLPSEPPTSNTLKAAWAP